jgi:hypothetical protein
MKLFSPNLFIPSLIVFLWSTTAVVTLGWGDEAAEKQGKLNGGYYLLHQLCEDEAKLPLLLDVKHAPSEIVNFADRISETAKECIADLEQMQDSNPAVKFNRNPLPPIERDVREAIQDEKQHQLLFGTSDAEFERALLVSQIEASNYARNIAKILANQETDPKRIKHLAKISFRWLTIHKESFRMLGAVK